MCLEVERTLGMAGRTEIYRCQKCAQVTRFPRLELQSDKNDNFSPDPEEEKCIFILISSFLFLSIYLTHSICTFQIQ